MIKWIKRLDCGKKCLSIQLDGTGEDCVSQRDGEVCEDCEGKLKGSLEWTGGIKVKEKGGFKESQCGINTSSR